MTLDTVTRCFWQRIMLRRPVTSYRLDTAGSLRPAALGQFATRVSVSTEQVRRSCPNRAEGPMPRFSLQVM